MVSIGRTTILVNDLDSAKAFYADAFGFATLYDGEVAPGLRTVHVGPDGPRGSGLWLMKTTSVAGESRVGAQTAGEPALVFYTESLAGDLARLASLGVTPTVAPFTNDAGFGYAHVPDNSGNEIVLVEWPSAESGDGDLSRTSQADDPASISGFFQDLFGWDSLPDPYTGSNTGNTLGEFSDEMLQNAALRAVLAPDERPLFVTVPDLETSLTNARELGATVLLDVTEVSGGRLAAIIADPQGTRITLGQEPLEQ